PPAVHRGAAALVTVLYMLLGPALVFGADVIRVLPGDDAVVVLAGPGRPVGAERGQPDGYDGSLLGCLVAAMVVQVGGREARVGRIHLDPGVPEFLGERDRDRVQRGLGRLVGDEVVVRERGLRI